MAEAADTLTDWTLTKVHHYLRVELGHTISRALYEMEQRRLARQLPVRVKKYVDDKPEGDPSYLPTDKTHEFVYGKVWVYPRGLEWGDFRCTVAEQDVRRLWPAVPTPLPAMHREGLIATDEPVRLPMKSKAWLLVEHKRRQQQCDVPKDITTYGEQLHNAAVEDVRKGRLTNAPRARRFDNLLHELSLFPKKKRRR